MGFLEKLIRSVTSSHHDKHGGKHHARGDNCRRTCTKLGDQGLSRLWSTGRFGGQLLRSVWTGFQCWSLPRMPNRAGIRGEVLFNRLQASRYLI